MDRPSTIALSKNAQNSIATGRPLVYRHDDPHNYDEKDPEHDHSVVQKPQDQPLQMEDEDFEEHSSSPPLSQDQISSEQNHENQPLFLNRRIRPQRVFEQILIIAPFIILAFWTGWFSQQLSSNFFLNQSNQSKTNANLVQSAWDKIDQNYVDRQDIDYKKMAYAAINAMVQSLGDTGHSRFMDPQEARKSNQQLSGKIIGIGVYLSQDTQTKNIIITATVPGSPAQKANLRHGDVIVAINGMNMKGKNIDSAKDLIKGPKGTIIHMTLQRPGENDLREVSLTRSEILATNVNMYDIPQSHIVDIQIVQFATGVTTQLRDVITQAKNEGATKIILDLRNNPGGYLQEAIDTTSLFVKHGNVLLEQDSSGKRTPIPVNNHESPVDTSSQIIVLVNENSASAAEIVSGALHDNHRAILLGQKTFGTGTILGQFTLADGSVLYLGTQEWLTPNGHFIRQSANKPGSGGITPDIIVPATPNTITLTPIDASQQHLTEQQLLDSGDVQLSAAIQYLIKQ
jgi:carboxyl-terminal processing protease